VRYWPTAMRNMGSKDGKLFWGRGYDLCDHPSFDVELRLGERSYELCGGDRVIFLLSPKVAGDPPLSSVSGRRYGGGGLLLGSRTNSVDWGSWRVVWSKSKVFLSSMWGLASIDESTIMVYEWVWKTKGLRPDRTFTYNIIIDHDAVQSFQL
jgi:hypothetical protein